MQKRTLILLCSPRCGSTAVFRMFQKHPDVGICDENPCTDNCEPHFWSLAIKAMAGNPEQLIRKLTLNLPSLVLPDTYTEESVFALWDAVLAKQGPVVFDKSPYYLGNRKAMDLLCAYMQRGNDVRIFALIRDPRDAITSQYELWMVPVKEATPQMMESTWLDQYSHLEELQKKIGHIPVFRYEDLSAAPACYAPMIYSFCGLRNLPYTYDHLKPVSVGRKSVSVYTKVKQWKMSDAFKEHMRKYGYGKIEESMGRWLFRFIRMFPGNMCRVLVNLIQTRNMRYYIKIRGLKK